MQIHELNNYVGELDADAYLAVDNGNDTGKVTVSGLLQPATDGIDAANARIDNIIAAPAPSQQEIIDGRLGFEGTTYGSLGDAIRGQAESLANDITNLFSEDAFDFYTPVLGKYYDGNPGTNPSYNYYVVPVVKGVTYYFEPYIRMYVIKDGTGTRQQDLTDYRKSFTANYTGLAYITEHADQPASMHSVIGENSANIEKLKTSVLSYDLTGWAANHVIGKYFDIYGNIDSSSTYNYYDSIPVIKGNSYRFTGSMGARFAVLKQNGVIVQSAQKTKVFMAEYSGDLYVTEYAADPVTVVLDDSYYRLKEWTNKNVNEYTNQHDVNLATQAGDILHIKLNGYTGQYFQALILYGVVNGSNVKLVSIYSDTGEAVIIAPNASSYYLYVQKSQPETAVLSAEITNLSDGTIFNTLDQLKLSDRLNSKIYGKTIACLGDSFTYGVLTYVSMIKEKYAANAINYGVASSRIVLDHDTGGGVIAKSFLNRYADMTNDADIVTIFGGINDAYDLGAGTLTLGDIDSALDTSTFYGGLKLLVTDIMKKYPDKQIIGIVPPDCQNGQYYIDNLPDVQKAEREVYNYYGIPVIDIKNECYKMSTLPEMVALYRGSLSDIHPSTAGQEALRDTIAAGIRRIIP